MSETDVFGHSGTQSGLGNLRRVSSSRPRRPAPAASSGGSAQSATIPTTTNDLLGPDKWGLGPTLVALVQKRGWTVGILANQIWSVGGEDDQQNINSMFLQPFLSYTTKSHTTFALDIESTYDWDQSVDGRPLNLTVSQILKIGKQPVSIQFGGRYYANAPSGGPDLGLRFNFTFLFPTAKPKPGPGHVAGTAAK